MLTQNGGSVVPPLPSDRETLKDFATIIQGNFRDLFQYAHTHAPLTAAPSSTDGQIGDIRLAKVSSTWYLYAKVAASTWLRVALS